VSGFVAILNEDGSPADVSTLRTLTEFLTFRGPDAQHTWSSGPAGLGHTLLRTIRETPEKQQPFSIDGKSFIVADARIDGREDLLRALAGLPGAPAPVSSDAPDAELILLAYQAWGEDCAAHLLGDFAFVIWDAARRRLFAARDHFGVKPLFYARLNGALILSNTLDCIRRHPGVSDRLDDLSIADFLLFDMIQDPAATSFQDIRRVPAAHTLTFQNGNLVVRRYWELSVKTPIHYKRESEYVEHFSELLDAAVADRVGAGPVGVLMSGGLDSPTIAASTKRVLLRAGKQDGLRAYTEVFDHLIPHEERRYAALVAEGLQIPIEFLASDDAKIFGRAVCHSPEPVHCAWPDSTPEQLSQVSQHSRIALTGFGGDPLLSSLLSVHFRQLLRERRIGQAIGDAMRYLFTEARFSRLYIRKRLRRWFPPKGEFPDYPEWLNEELERRLLLRERWTALSKVSASTSNEMVRPIAHEQTVAGAWTNILEAFDSGITGIPVEVCHPFFDLRLVHFLLALPTVPWCCDKELLREAARRTLPDRVRLRRKSPLSADPLVALLKKDDSAWIDRFQPVPELERFVNRKRVPKALERSGIWSYWTHLRPLSLNFWLSKGRNTPSLASGMSAELASDASTRFELHKQTP